MDAWISDEVLTGRGGVEALRTLLYGRNHRRRLLQQLNDLLEPRSRITRCDLERAKFKPGRKLTGYYLATVAGPQPSRRAVEVVWSRDPRSDDLGADEAAMQDEARVAGVAAPFRRLCDRPADGPWVQVAPLDVSYPQLVRLSRPDHVRRLLETVAGTHPSRVATTYDVTALRYRPRQRHVLRYDPEGAPGPGSVFAKLYRSGAAVEAVAVAEHLAELVDRPGGQTASVRPLGACPADDVVLYPRVPGRPLSRRLGEPAATWGRHLVTAGILLRSIHAEGVADGVSTLRQHDLDAELRAVARAAEHLAALVPATAARVTELLETAAAAGASVPSERPGLAHGDYKTDHLWALRERLTLLDFDTCCLAEPALDLGKFLADLSWWFAATDRAGLGRAQELFLQGYGDVTPERLARARVYEAVTLTKLTIRRFRRFEPDWAVRTAALIDDAARRLGPRVPAQKRMPSGSLAR